MVWESNGAHAGFSSARPWLPVPQEHVARAVNREVADRSSVLAHYRRMIVFRKAHPALRSGSIAFVASPADVLAFIREGDGETILCVFNLAAGGANFTVPPDLKVSALDGHGFAASLDAAGRTVSLGGRDAFFGKIA
jgi:alpha-glucosidase